MKILLLTVILALAGCSTTVPITQTWPEAPGLQSMQSCPELRQLGSSPQLSDVAQVITHNYTSYYTCVVKLEAWQEWYRQQEIIYKRLR